MSATTLPRRHLARRSIGGLGLGLLLALLVPVVALAHPLGNFTINHYAGIRVAPSEIQLDVVIDQAEIPAFQERQRIDANADGEVSDEEIEAERTAACPGLADSLELQVAGSTISLTAAAAGLSFPPGAGGLSTMRLVCEYVAALPSDLSAPTKIRFADRSFAARIGWREIVVEGDRTTVSSDGLAGSSISKRLTVYPTDLLTQPLDMREAAFAASPGGPALASLAVPDARPLASPPGAPPVDASGGLPSSASPADAAPAAVPGGVGNEISSLLRSGDLTPPVVLLSLLAAMVLGAGHALTPGHGKTVMAAYLVGTRGTARHAIALGLTVTISHTLGVLGLALVILTAGRAVPPEHFSRVLAVASGMIVLGIGLWLLYGRYTAWRRTKRAAAAMAAVHQLSHANGEDHAHHDVHDHGADHAHRHANNPGHDHGHGHEHANNPGHDHRSAPTHGGIPSEPNHHEHTHGGIRHSHLPAENATLTWRSLFALGLSGGLVPSTNALLILLATLVTGRAAYGLVLVIAFGAGMALVLGGVGLALVYAAGLVERMPSRRSFARLAVAAPLLTAVVVFALGIYLTGQALVQVL